MNYFVSFYGINLGGNLKKAVANADRSIKEIQKGDRDYTYCELGRLIRKL